MDIGEAIDQPQPAKEGTTCPGHRAVIPTARQAAPYVNSLDQMFLGGKRRMQPWLTRSQPPGELA